MNRSLFALSLAFAAPAVAGTYSAQPAAPLESGRIVGRDIVWTCGPDACLGATAASRPIILCKGLAKRAGQLDAFVADGRAFNRAELAQCNASAKAATTPAANAR